MPIPERLKEHLKSLFDETASIQNREDDQLGAYHHLVVASGTHNPDSLPNIDEYFRIIYHDFSNEWVFNNALHAANKYQLNNVASFNRWALAHLFNNFDAMCQTEYTNINNDTKALCHYILMNWINSMGVSQEQKKSLQYAMFAHYIQSADDISYHHINFILDGITEFEFVQQILDFYIQEEIPIMRVHLTNGIPYNDLLICLMRKFNLKISIRTDTEHSWLSITSLLIMNGLEAIAEKIGGFYLNNVIDGVITKIGNTIYTYRNTNLRCEAYYADYIDEEFAIQEAALQHQELDDDLESVEADDNSRTCPTQEEQHSNAKRRRTQ